MRAVRPGRWWSPWPRRAALVVAAFVIGGRPVTGGILAGRCDGGPTTGGGVDADVLVGDVTRVALSLDGCRAYLVNPGPNTVTVLDTTTNRVVATTPVGDEPRGLAAIPDGRRVYVSNYGSNTVSVIDTATDTVTATIPVGDGPAGVAVSADGRRVYVAAYPAYTVIDVATGVATTADPDVGRIALSPDGSRVYVANYQDGTVTVIDTAEHTVVTTVPVGELAESIAISPDGPRAFVANRTAGTVAVFGIG